MACSKVVNDKVCGKKTKIQVEGQFYCAKHAPHSNEPDILEQIRELHAKTNEIYAWMLESKQRKEQKEVNRAVPSDVEQLTLTPKKPKVVKKESITISDLTQ